MKSERRIGKRQDQTRQREVGAGAIQDDDDNSRGENA